MSAWTFDEAKEYLTDALASRKAILSSQSYQDGDHSLIRADLKAINDDIKYWKKEVTKLSDGGTGKIKVKLGVPNG